MSPKKLFDESYVFRKALPINPGIFSNVSLTRFVDFTTHSKCHCPTVDTYIASRKMSSRRNRRAKGEGAIYFPSWHRKCFTPNETSDVRNYVYSIKYEIDGKSYDALCDQLDDASLKAEMEANVFNRVPQNRSCRAATAIIEEDQAFHGTLQPINPTVWFRVSYYSTKKSNPSNHRINLNFQYHVIAQVPNDKEDILSCGNTWYDANTKAHYTEMWALDVHLVKSDLPTGGMTVKEAEDLAILDLENVWKAFSSKDIRSSVRSWPARVLYNDFMLHPAMETYFASVYYLFSELFPQINDKTQASLDVILEQ